MLKCFIQKIVCIAALATSCLFADVDYVIENQPQVIEQVTELSHKGILKQKDNGYLYVEVSNEFIAKALPFIEAGGKIVPPRHFTSKKGIGAHISVMYENEQILNEIWEIKELGKEFSFEILELRTVKINRDNKMKKLWLIAVSSPELEQLRMSYGLSPKLKGHDFHITLGTQIPGAKVPLILCEEELLEEAS